MSLHFTALPEDEDNPWHMSFNIIEARAAVTKLMTHVDRRRVKTV
jgi:hypothetical protein